MGSRKAEHRRPLTSAHQKPFSVGAGLVRGPAAHRRLPHRKRVRCVRGPPSSLRHRAHWATHGPTATAHRPAGLRVPSAAQRSPPRHWHDSASLSARHRDPLEDLRPLAPGQPLTCPGSLRAILRCSINTFSLCMFALCSDGQVRPCHCSLDQIPCELVGKRMGNLALHAYPRLAVLLVLHHPSLMQETQQPVAAVREKHDHPHQLLLQ